MTSSGLGLRERKKLKTRLAIETAALKLFDTQGFDETTVEEIAAAVEISPRTLFRYFPSKEHIVFAQSEAILTLLLADVDAQPSEAPEVAVVREALMTFAAGLELHRDETLARSRLLAAYPALHRRALQLEADWQEAIARALAHRAGKTEPDLRLRIVAACSLSANRLATDSWRDHRGEIPLPQLLGAAFDAIGNEFGGSGKWSPDAKPRPLQGSRSRLTKDGSRGAPSPRVRKS